MIKSEILKKTEKFAQKIMTDIEIPGHDFSHILRVKKWAIKLARLEKVDSFKIQMVALLHDIGRGREDYKKGLAHAEISAILAEPYLKKFKELSKTDREEIVEAISRHSKGNKGDSKLTQVFQDADRLDGLGIIGVTRDFLFLHKMPLYHSLKSFQIRKWTRGEIDAKKEKGEEVFSDIISGIIFTISFYDMMNTKSGKVLARPLIKEMKDFLTKLKKEL